MKLILLGLFAFNVLAFDHSHQKFSDLLKDYTSRNGYQVSVNYKELKKNSEKLKAYLSELEALSKNDFEGFSKNQKLAFWINAYNAYTLKLIIDHYPIDSIKDVGSIFTGPWDQKFITLFGKEMTLNDIEHSTIRKDFEEPKIHFAVNCASKGCPSLKQEAYVGSKLDQQLESATKNFLENKKKNFYDESKNTLFISKIFKWYGDDFKEKFGSPKKFIQGYIKTQKNVQIEYLDYDWKLNN